MPGAEEARESPKCSQCGGPGGAPIDGDDLSVLGDVRQVEGAGGAFAGSALGALGLRIARRVAAQTLAGLAFCPACRAGGPPVKSPFSLPKALAVVGFLLGFFPVGLPLALPLYLAGFVLLKRRLRSFRQAPTAPTLRSALDATGTLAMAVIANAMIALTLAAVVAYLLLVRR